MISLSPWLLATIVLAVMALAVVAGFAITRARRLDRLHQRILASRDSLSRLLLRRASEADLLAAAPGWKALASLTPHAPTFRTGETSSPPMASTAELRRNARAIVSTSRRVWSVHPPCLEQSVRLSPPKNGRGLRRILGPVRAWKRWMRRAIASSSHATCITWTSRERAPCVPHEW